MAGLLERLLPREVGFFDLFAKQAANIHVGADALEIVEESAVRTEKTIYESDTGG
jgi:hypothetical protein